MNVFASAYGSGGVSIGGGIGGGVYLGACGGVRAAWIKRVIVCYVCVIRFSDNFMYVLLVTMVVCVVK